MAKKTPTDEQREAAAEVGLSLKGGDEVALTVFATPEQIDAVHEAFCTEPALVFMGFDVLEAPPPYSTAPDGTKELIFRLRTLGYLQRDV